jgi:predicted TIM-barrel fold metal-dependent hydrolase
MRVPKDATTDPDVAKDVLGGKEFVFDVQTHFLELEPDGGLPSFPQSSCDAGDPVLCYSMERYMEELFLRSDTNLAVISAVPAIGVFDGALTPQHMGDVRRLAETLCGDERIVMHGQANPSVGRVEDRLEEMSRLVEQYEIGAWKVYTHAGGPGWYLDDHDATAPQCGVAFLDRVRESGVKTVCVHKGFGNGSEYASPVDVGPAATSHPDITFVAYHSGFESGNSEGAYDPNGGGVDRFIRTLDDNDIEPGANVYAELGSTWFSVMRDPDRAAHVLGKLLKAVGPERILWGTDSIWYGTPQGQIEAFRAFEITPEYQEQFGYPALTPEVKERILGLNAAALYGVDPVTTRCDFTRDELADVRQALPSRPASYGPTTEQAVRAHIAEHGWVGF